MKVHFYQAVPGEGQSGTTLCADAAFMADLPAQDGYCQRQRRPMAKWLMIWRHQDNSSKYQNFSAKACTWVCPS